MAKEIRIIAHCDVCYVVLGGDAGDDTVRLDLGSGMKDLDLCAAHRDELYAPLRALYESAGATPAPDARKAAKAARDVLPEPWVCIVCGAPTGRHRTTINAHLSDVHQTTRGRLNADKGDGADVVDGRPLTHECGECGERFSNGQALGQHWRGQPDHQGKGGAIAR